MLDKFSKVNPETINIMNTKVIDNYSKLKPSLFILPLFILLAIILFLYNLNALSVDRYVQVQKNYFIFLNSKLSQFPATIYNLTQIGDAMIFMSFLTLFILYAPKIWESLFSASIVSALLCPLFKNLFSVPRPAQVFDITNFVIVGRRLPGFSSLPSGHSITVFTILTILLFGFMPKNWRYKFLWWFLLISIGLMIAFTRVGVGAHHPLDVIIGCTIGYICGLMGIFISRKYKIWSWISNKKYYPFFIVLFLVCCAVLITKISKENLIIYYLSLTSLIVSLYKFIYVYVKK